MSDKTITVAQGTPANFDAFMVRTVKLCELTDECIEKIADAIAQKILERESEDVSD